MKKVYLRKDKESELKFTLKEINERPKKNTKLGKSERLNKLLCVPPKGGSLTQTLTIKNN